MKAVIDEIGNEVEAEEEILLTDSLYNQYMRQLKELESEIHAQEVGESNLLENISIERGINPGRGIKWIRATVSMCGRYLDITFSKTVAEDEE